MANYFGPYDVETLPDAPNENWEARRQLAAALRRLNGLTVTSTADAQIYADMASVINAQVDILAAQPQGQGKLAQIDPEQDYAEQRGTISHEIGPLTGLCNPVAPPMNIWFEDDKVRARVTMGWQYEGPPGCIHGGHIAALFDDFLGVGQKLTGQIGFTGTIEIRYIKPTPLDEEINMVGWLERRDGRKNILHGEMYAGDTLTASAEGLFIQRPVLSYRDEEHTPSSESVSRSAELKAADAVKRRP